MSIRQRRIGRRKDTDRATQSLQPRPELGHLFYNRRLKAAITRFSVRMKHDDRKQQAAVALSMVFVLIGIGWMALLHVMKPAGLIGQSAIIGNRDTGAVYAKINGRLYPALNLTSARLAVGNAAAVAWVKASEIAKYPTGPMIGIPGVPDDLTVTPTSTSAWSVCDTVPTRGAGAPLVTSIAGELDEGGRAAPMPRTDAVLATHIGATYVIWGGQRSEIDPADRSVTFNLGLDPGVTYPIEMSNALFDALPSTEPLVIPAIPESGTPSTLLPGSTVGSVLETRDANGNVTGFYVLLRTASRRSPASSPTCSAPPTRKDRPRRRWCRRTNWSTFPSSRDSMSTSTRPAS